MEIVLVIVVAVVAAALVLFVVRGRLSEALSERDTARAELEAVRGEREEALRKLAAAEAEYEARTEELAKARGELETQFKGIAADVAKANSEALLKQAKEQFENQKKLSEADLEQRQQAIEGLVKPVKDNLAKFEQRVNQIEEKREGAYGELKGQIDQLHKATGGLREALRSSNVRGLWGEQTLRNILEVSGMRENIDFFEQHSIASEDRKLRPDAVVRVPGGINVVIDAKAPLDSYLKAHNEQDENVQEELLKSHARSLMERAKELGDKGYAAAVDGSPDFTVMFVPADPILDAAIDVQPTLWDEAWRRHQVLIATPGLLLAFLRTVDLAWKQQEFNKNTQEIAKDANALYNSLRVYASHVSNVRKGLIRAVEAYDDSIGSLERNVLSKARKFEELGLAITGKRIEDVSPIGLVPKAISAAELVEAEAEPTVPELTEGEDD